MNFVSFTLHTININEKGTLTDDDGRSKEFPFRERFPYLEGGQQDKSVRVRRAVGSNILLRFAGRRFPPNGRASSQELYCASMLLLFSPWRSLQDLKRPMETFAESFDRFSSVVTCDPKILQVIENFQSAS